MKLNQQLRELSVPVDAVRPVVAVEGEHHEVAAL
jgi:hypothetical protein